MLNGTLQKLTIIGRVGLAPKVMEYSDGEKKMVLLSVATDESYWDRNAEEWNKATEWHSVKFFGKNADYCAKNIEAGSHVFIEAKIKTNKWEDKNGEVQYSTDIIGSIIGLLGAKKAEESSEEVEEVLA